MTQPTPPQATSSQVHVTTLKVRGYHLDLYGHVNNARYLEFLEEARWALMEERPQVAALHERGLAFVVVNITIDYRHPATNGDVLEIASRIAHVGTRSMAFAQVATLADTQTVVAQARVTFVLVDTATGRAVVLDDDLRSALGIPPGATGEIP